MSRRTRSYLWVSGLMLALVAHAAGGFAPGEKLSEAEIAELGDLPSYNVGKTRVRVMPSDQTDDHLTWLLNSQGMVGTSRNQVMVAGAPPDAQEIIQQTQPRPVSVLYHEQTQIIVATYADFGLAAEALNALKESLPTATLALPMVFDLKVPKSTHSDGS